MEVMREIDIARFLTRGGAVFICPSFHIEPDSDFGDGGTDPDIVVLDFKAREVVVVEVSTASNLSKFFEHVRRRQTRWFAPIRRHLEEFKVGVEQWPIRFLGFIRELNLAAASKKFTGESDVAFFPIESATFDWAYTEGRLSDGLPR